MEPIKSGDRRVRNYLSEAFSPLLDAEGQPTGASVFQMEESLRPGLGFHLYRLEPGASSDPHEHSCNEQFIILEGDLVDHDGTRYAPGDFVWLKAGTRHNSHSPNGCLLAVYFETPGKDLDETV